VRRPRLSLCFGVLLILAGAIWAIERLVVTDEEALEALVRAAAEAIRSDDGASLERTLAPEFEASQRDRAGTVRWVGRQWRRYRPFRLEVEVGRIGVEGDRATLQAVGSMTVMARPVEVHVDLEARRAADGWLFTGARYRVSVGAGADLLR